MTYDTTTDPHQVFRFILGGKLAYLREQILDGRDLHLIEWELRRLTWEIITYQGRTPPEDLEIEKQNPRT